MLRRDFGSNGRSPGSIENPPGTRLIWKRLFLGSTTTVGGTTVLSGFFFSLGSGVTDPSSSVSGSENMSSSNVRSSSLSCCDKHWTRELTILVTKSRYDGPYKY